MEKCSCGSDIYYPDCCGIFISGKKSAPTAEALMRSRYTAYTKAELAYIEQTMKGRPLARFDRQKSETRTNYIRWNKLEVIKTSQQGTRHFVEFIAHFSVNDRHDILHERSEFLFENNRWYYIDGVIFPVNILEKSKKIGRNMVCSCGSLKKFKHCCGR